MLRLLLFFLAAVVTNLWGLVDLAIWSSYQRRTQKARHQQLPLDLFVGQMEALKWEWGGGEPARG